MHFVFYRMRYRDGKVGPWMASRSPLPSHDAAEKLATELLGYRASAGQQEYADAVVSMVVLP